MNLSQAKQPNFFIVGAPKCGTTALYTYLSNHPNIYMPRIKEPHFFADDLRLPNRVTRLDDYLALFQYSKPHHTALGEASVHYLQSKTAIEKIHKFSPTAKIIVMLRNPIDLVYSYHSQRLYGFQEDVEDFEAAWHLQTKRLNGECIPKGCLEPSLLQYDRVGMLGIHIERLFTLFAQEQIKCILFEDFITSTKFIYEDVLSFLNIKTDGKIIFPIINENRSHYSPLLGRLMIKPPLPLAKLKDAFRIHNDTNIAKFLYKLNSRKVKRPPLLPEFRKELLNTFHEDILKLESLLNKDLQHWH